MDINVFVSGQGFHFLKQSILNGTFEPDKPEPLVYAMDTNSNRLRLVAEEYAVPLDASPTPSEGFAGDADIWDRNEEFGLWTLHAWIWSDNPNGIFAESSPRVP